MTVLLNQSGQIVVNRSGQVISCDTVPEVCGSSSWQVVMNVESGSIDEENKYGLCEEVCRFVFRYYSSATETAFQIIGGSVEILGQNNCYVINYADQCVIPEPDSGAIPYFRDFPFQNDYIPFAVVYCWSASGHYVFKPYNEVAEWSATVRAVVTFDRVVTLCDMATMFQEEYPEDGCPKFPNIKITYTLKPIQLTGAEDGEDNEI